MKPLSFYIIYHFENIQIWFKRIKPGYLDSFHPTKIELKWGLTSQEKEIATSNAQFNCSCQNSSDKLTGICFHFIRDLSPDTVIIEEYRRKGVSSVE